MESVTPYWFGPVYNSSPCKRQQDSISVGYVPPICQPYVLWWSPLGFSTGGGISQVSCLEGVYIPTPLVYLPPWTYPPTPWKGPGTRDTHPHRRDQAYTPWTDRHLWKHYLPTTTVASGNEDHKDTSNWSQLLLVEVIPFAMAFECRWIIFKIWSTIWNGPKIIFATKDTILKPTLICTCSQPNSLEI